MKRQLLLLKIVCFVTSRILQNEPLYVLLNPLVNFTKTKPVPRRNRGKGKGKYGVRVLLVF